MWTRKRTGRYQCDRTDLGAWRRRGGASCSRTKSPSRRCACDERCTCRRCHRLIDGDGELGRRRIAPKPLADVLDVGVRELEHLREVVDHSGVDRAAPGVRMVREGDAPGLALRAEEVELERRIVVLLS